MKTAVIYSSLTGNTKKVAEAIYEGINGEKELFNIDANFNLEDYEVLAIGYWIDRGSCDNKVKALLEKTQNKKVILFGTLGASENDSYYSHTKSNIEKLVPANNELLGHFLCQGKINEKLKEKYEEMLKLKPDDIHIKAQLKNYEESQEHPSFNDLEHARTFAKKCL